MKINLILFDLDGTLIDSRKDIAYSVNHMLEKLGHKKRTQEEIVSFIGRGISDLIQKSVGETDKSTLDKAITIFESHYRKHGTDNSVLYPGVLEMLKYFSNKKKSVVTNRSYEFAKAVLKKLKIDKFFEDIAGGDDINCMKPSSCSLDGVVARAKEDKKKTMMVGDMDIDILAGKKAGVLTCAVTYGFGKKEDIEKSEPDYIIEDLDMLKEIIE